MVCSGILGPPVTPGLHLDILGRDIARLQLPGFLRREVQGVNERQPLRCSHRLRAVVRNVEMISPIAISTSIRGAARRVRKELVHAGALVLDALTILGPLFRAADEEGDVLPRHVGVAHHQLRVQRLRADRRVEHGGVLGEDVGARSRWIAAVDERRRRKSINVDESHARGEPVVPLRHATTQPRRPFCQVKAIEVVQLQSVVLLSVPVGVVEGLVLAVVRQPAKVGVLDVPRGPAHHQRWRVAPRADRALRARRRSCIEGILGHVIHEGSAGPQRPRLEEAVVFVPNVSATRLPAAHAE
mmetsp:Transcript_869/g.3612  ORF Transcript_869/g.3612 Transcript_869/m.3612 type:complete len:300 (+) Transcript_869:3531-4430(+)